LPFNLEHKEKIFIITKGVNCLKKVVLTLLLSAVFFAGLMSCVQAQKPASPGLTLLYFYSDG